MNQQPPMVEVQRLADSDPLASYDFVLDELSPHKVSGHLVVTSKCCQPFGVLHGGVSALIAEDLASYGAAAAAGWNRVAGVQLSINHVKSAVIGDLVVAEATPVNVGKSVQVWNVRISKCDPSNTEIKTLISTSNVTVLCYIGASEHDKDTDVRRHGEHAKM